MVANLARFALLPGVVVLTMISARWMTWPGPEPISHRCPALLGDAHARATVAAFDQIASELSRGSTEHIRASATLIANYFAPVNEEIAECARRLAQAENLAAARREFARLTQLFSSATPRPESTPPLA